MECAAVLVEERLELDLGWLIDDIVCGRCGQWWHS
jgi:hypothetical protein